MSAPLLDTTGGVLKGWPGGCLYLPDGRVEHTFHPSRPDEQPAAVVHVGSDSDKHYCKYCYQDSRWLELHESLAGQWYHSLMICSECGYGVAEGKGRIAA